MKSRQMLIPLVLVAIAAGAFAATLTLRAGAAQEPKSAPSPVLAWLEVPQPRHSEILDEDPQFETDLRRLRAELATRREDLAGTLEKSDASDQEIRAAAEAVLAAGNALERRITSHLLAIRHHLTSAQQQRLFGLCAQGLRDGPGWRARAGGRGPGPHGPADGMGPGSRFGGAPATRP